jgi:hypothetical protein
MAEQISLLDLKRKGACRDERESFLQLFGRRTTLSEENLDTFWDEYDPISRLWFVKNFLTQQEVIEFYKKGRPLYSKAAFKRVFFGIYNRRNK